jgi:hypothetical protein
MTPELLLVGCVALVAGVTVADPAAQLLAADMRDAIHLACRSLKSIAIDIDVPMNKLSDQLNGKAPFTYCSRILATFPDVRLEFCDIQAQRVEAMVIRCAEIRDLVSEVKQFTRGVRKRMAKAAMPDIGRKAQAV